MHAFFLFHLSNWQFSGIIFDVKEGAVKWLSNSLLVEMQMRFFSSKLKPCSVFYGRRGRRYILFVAIIKGSHVSSEKHRSAVGEATSRFSFVCHGEWQLLKVLTGEIILHSSYGCQDTSLFLKDATVKNSPFID